MPGSCTGIDSCDPARRVCRCIRCDTIDPVHNVDSTARRQLTDQQLEAIAFAAYEFITGPLLENSQRVGKQLRPPLHDRHSARRGTYRVIYRIDEARHRVTVVGVFAPADAYRPR